MSKDDAADLLAREEDEAELAARLREVRGPDKGVVLEALARKRRRGVGA